MPLHNSKSNAELKSTPPGTPMKSPEGPSSRHRQKTVRSEKSLSYSMDMKRFLGESPEMWHSQYLSPLSYSAQAQRYYAQNSDHQEAESPSYGGRAVFAKSDLQRHKSMPFIKRMSSTGVGPGSESSDPVTRAHRACNCDELSSDELDWSGRQPVVDNKQGSATGLKPQGCEQCPDPWQLSIYSWLSTVPESAEEMEIGLQDFDSFHHNWTLPSVEVSSESLSGSRLSSSTEVGMSSMIRAPHITYRDSIFSVNSMASSESTALVLTMAPPAQRRTQSPEPASVLDPRLVFADSLSWGQSAPAIETSFSWSPGQDFATQGDGSVADRLARQRTPDRGVRHREMESVGETDFVLSPNVTPYRKGKDPKRKRRPSYYDDDILGAKIAA